MSEIRKPNSTRALVYGAMCIAMSMLLSYVKLFEMPMGGSITLCSMLPVCAYAWVFGPGWGFGAALAFGALQLIVEPYVVHPVQLALDYFLAFGCYGLPSLFKKLPFGLVAAGAGRALMSTLSGVLFFASYAAEAGFENAWLYSICYNGSYCAVETALCVVLVLIPAVQGALGKMHRA